MLTLNNWQPIMWSNIKRAISAIPAADVREEKRGKWQSKTAAYGNYEMHICPFCESSYLFKHNFCPNCGADMREETE